MRLNYKFFLAILIITNLFLTQYSHAIPWGKFATGIKNIFKKSDDVIDASQNLGKKADDVSGLNKSENLLSGDSPQLFDVKINKVVEQSNQAYNSELYSYVSTKKIGKILKDHGLDAADNIVDLNDFFKNSPDKVITNPDFDPYVLPFWLARFIRASTYFNKSENDEKKALYCSFYEAGFNFIFILHKEKNIALLTRQTLINKEIKKQQLHVLKDEPEYSIFSTQIEKGQKYPRLYFVLYANQKFNIFMHATNSYSPEEIFSMVSKTSQFRSSLNSYGNSGTCFLVNKEGAFKINN